jgi:hypothetical protein
MVKMVTKTTASTETKCDECGTYDSVCCLCKIPFDNDQTIYCDDEQYNEKSTGKHWCEKCHKEVKKNDKKNN